MATESRPSGQSAAPSDAKPIRTAAIGSWRRVPRSAHGTRRRAVQPAACLGLVSTTIIIAGLYYGRVILVPLALAFLLGFVLDPWVTRLKRLGLPRPPP